MESKKNREGFYVGEFERECTNKDCRKIFKKTSKTVTLCNECNSKRVKSSSIEYKIVARAKQRAKVDGLDFNIEISDIKIPLFCPILLIPLNVHSGESGGRFDSPSIDKIDPTKGYIKGNIMIISHLANMMKSCANKEQLILFAKWILNNYDGRLGS